MNPLLLIVLYFILLLAMPSCSKNKALHHEFTLKPKQSVKIPLEHSYLHIKFSKLIQDSRCPPDAYCAWAGQTIVALVVNDSTFIVGPNTSGMSYGSYNIQLLKVNYTNKRHFGEEKYCRIKLRVD